MAREFIDTMHGLRKVSRIGGGWVRVRRVGSSIRESTHGRKGHAKRRADSIHQIFVAGLLCALAAFLLGGCATGPTYSEIGARMSPIPEGQGRIFFYRPAAMVGGAARPSILLNDRAVGNAEPRGFLFVDREPGQYTVKTSVLIEHLRNFELESGQIRYVRLTSSVGVMVAHVIPQIVDGSRALPEMQPLAYTGSSDLITGDE